MISSGGLGDTVLFAHVVDRFMSLARDGEPVTILLRQNAMKMAFLMPAGAKIIGIDYDRLRGDLGYRRQVTDDLFRAHFRLIVHTDHVRHPDLDEALVAAAMAPEAVAMEPRPWRKYDRRLRANRRLYTRLYDSGPVYFDKVIRWTRFANWLTGRNEPPPMARFPADRLPAPAADAPAVLIHPFSAVKGKQSSPATFRRIIEAMPKGTTFVISGAPADFDTNPEYRPLLDLPGVRFDDASFADRVPVLRAVRLVVTVDTSLMHLAVAVGAPTLCLASAAYVAESVPYDAAIAPPNVRFIYHPMPCEGCFCDCVLPAENGMFPCVARLDGEQIVAAAREMLAAAQGRRTP